MMDKTEALHQLFTEMEEVDLPLRSESPLIPGHGNPDAMILFIGEAGGYHEAQERKPFVGRAGKLLNKALEHFGLKREDVWITNVVKARPPQNRDPQPEEIEAYRPYLERELAIVQPRIIATLGRFAMEWFLGESNKISKIHGNARKLSNGVIIFPLYHPAAALRNGSVLEVFKEDFGKLAALSRDIEDGSEAHHNDDEEVQSPIDSEHDEAQQQSLF